jgi:hypothetical protein
VNERVIQEKEANHPDPEPCEGGGTKNRGQQKTGDKKPGKKPGTDGTFSNFENRG